LLGAKPTGPPERGRERWVTEQVLQRPGDSPDITWLHEEAGLPMCDDAGLFSHGRRNHGRALHQCLEHREGHAFAVRRKNEDLRTRDEDPESLWIYPARYADGIRNAELLRAAPGLVDLSVTGEHKRNVGPARPNLGKGGEEV